MKPPCTPACYATVDCLVCGKRKAPRGRSVAVAMAGGLCDTDCPGYHRDPQPGHLWPEAAKRRRRTHTCPPWCHRCPELDGEIMPICMGCSNPGTDLGSCTCDRRTTWMTKLKAAQDEAAKLWQALHETHAALGVLRLDHLRLERYARQRWGPLPWDPVEVKKAAGRPDGQVREFKPRGESA